MNPCRTALILFGDKLLAFSVRKIFAVIWLMTSKDVFGSHEVYYLYNSNDT